LPYVKSMVLFETRFIKIFFEFLVNCIDLEWDAKGITKKNIRIGKAKWLYIFVCFYKNILFPVTFLIANVPSFHHSFNMLRKIGFIRDT
jgi:hypothetical protein